MRKETIIFVEREDLLPVYENKDIKDIDYDHFIGNTKSFRLEPFAIFVDRDGTTKLLKNRFGDKGVVIPKVSNHQIIINCQMPINRKIVKPKTKNSRKKSKV